MLTDQPTQRRTSDTRLTRPWHPLLLYGPLLLLGLSTGYLLYRNAQLRTELRQLRGTAYRLVSTHRLASDRQQLTMSLNLLAWAVREPLQQRKMNTVNALLTQLAGEPGVRELLLVDPRGRVLFSSVADRRGSRFGDRFPAYLLRQPDVYFNNKKPYELAAPVGTANRRLGTLVMFYAPRPAPADLAAGREPNQ